MRTTLTIDDQLFRQLKSTAAQRGETLSALVEELLRQALAVKEKQAPKPFEWRTWDAELQPGIDICDRNSLFDAMDGR